MADEPAERRLAIGGVMAGRPRVALILALAAIGFLYLLFLASIIAVMANSWQAVNLPLPAVPGQLKEADFSIFWFSGRWILLRMGHAFGIAGLPDAKMIWFHAQIVAVDKPLVLSWLYPPAMGVLASLYALLPLPVSFWACRVAFVLIAIVLLRNAGLAWAAIIMGLAGPAALIDLLGGQNGTLTGSLLVSSLLLIDRKPLTSGMLAGMLCIKPQIGIVLPFILLRRHRRVALAACALCVFAIIILTLPLMGWPAWRAFLHGGTYNSASFVSVPLKQRFASSGATVFFMARSFHATTTQAWVAQAISSIGATLALYTLWRGPSAAPVARMAVTTCLWDLITPYGYLYDNVGFSVAMAAMFCRTADRHRPVFGVLWLAAGYAGTVGNLSGHLLFPIAAAFGAWWIGRTSFSEEKEAKRLL